MNAADLAFTPALEQARLIRIGEVSPLQLTELYLERINRLNPKLGSYFLVTAEQAIADAKAKTEQLAGGADASELPPFFGVPISIKDLVPVGGIPCSYGVRIIRNRMAEADSGVVTQIKKAGFVILGKTATSELGSTPFTEPAGFPPARNPWNPDYTPGGSSGGAASAAAAGLCAIAHGSDGGGSIRGPAFCCGLVGIKPSRGRISHAPVGDRLSGLATDGPLARTVADAAALLDALQGYLPGDPYWLPPPESSFLSATERFPEALKIGYITEIPPMGTVDPLCQAAVTDTVKRLESMGHQTEPISIHFGDIVQPIITVWQAGVDVGVPPLFLGKLNRWLWVRSRLRSSGMYLRAVNQMQVAARRIVTALMPYDAVVMPVFTHPTIRVGEWANLTAVQQFRRIVNWVAPCPIFNATGQPSIALPTGFSPTGLPMGVQIVGRPADEGTLIAIAAQLETAKPWTDRPAIAVD